MCRINFIMATQPTEYDPPLLDVRENLYGINGLNLTEVKQVAFHFVHSNKTRDLKMELQLCLLTKWRSVLSF